jgi:diguanylate cyclase (GGDEF)-like protein
MKTKILIVEDDRAVSEAMGQFLTRTGFLVIQALSAEEADDILKNEGVNLVIADINLPGKDGIQFTKNIKNKYNLDVLVTTGYSADYSYEDVVKNGASDLIFKPVRFEELLLRIERVIEERKLRDEREQMLQELKRLSIRDPLTELYNSRHFYAQLTKEIKRSDRYFHPLSLIFIDIDKFKVINDTHGHMIGDKILLLIADKINASLRSEDAAYRIAGDEFTAILPETNAEEAMVVADRIRSKIQNENIVIKGNVITCITVSIGIAEYRRNEELEHFVHRADLAMYQSKGSGGNKVAVAANTKNFSGGSQNADASHNIA